MRRFTILAGVLFALSVSAQTIIYSEDFESYDVGDNVGEDTEIPSGFLSYDVDGDGFNWGLSHPNNFYQDMHLVYDSNFIMSASYITEGNHQNEGSLNANNILVLPKISIPENSSGVELSYYVGAGTSHNYFSETYYVTVTTDNDLSTILSAQPIFSETLPTPEGRNLTIDLDEFSGQDIYIAFRHQTSDQWMLGLDNLKVETETLGVDDNSFNKFIHFLDKENQLNLQSNQPLENIQVLNMNGQKLISKKLFNSHERLNISSLDNGVYIIIVKINGKEKSFRILKK